jgi:flagellar motor switch protein FliM
MASQRSATAETSPVAPPEGEAEAGAEIRVRALDFSQPTKFTTEIRRRIAAALDPFCDALATAMAGECATEVKLGVGDVSQHTWASAKARLPADSIAVAIDAPQIERQMLLSVEPPLLLQTLECLLGGEASRAPAARHLTEIDWVLGKGLLDLIARELSAAWTELEGPALRRGEVDVESDAGLQIPASEPTLSIAVESDVGGATATMTLLLPWSFIEPFADRLLGSAQSAPAAAEEAGGMRHGLVSAQVLLRAEVGSVQMPIERMLELLPGTVVELGERADDGVALFAEEVSLGRGRPGRSGTRRAVKLEITGEPPSRAETYAKLGRGELERARAWAQAAREDVEAPAILRSIFVRVWAELGRTHMALAGALELAPGSVVELDQSADAPVELFANGLCFASGSLVVTPEGGWGVRVDDLV